MKPLYCKFCSEEIPPQWSDTLRARDEEDDVCETCSFLSECCGAEITEQGLCSDCKEQRW